MEIENKIDRVFKSSLFGWAILYVFIFFVYLSGINLGHTVLSFFANNISSLLELSLDILILCVSWVAYKKSEKDFSKYLLILFFSFIGNFFNDFNYIVLFDWMKIEAPKAS